MKHSRPHFHHAIELTNAIGDAGGFDCYDAAELDPPPLCHFEALIAQGFTDKQIMDSVLVPAIS